MSTRDDNQAPFDWAVPIEYENARAAPAAAQLDAELPPLLTVEQVVELIDGSEYEDPESGNKCFDRLGFAKAVERKVIAPYAERIRLLTEDQGKYYGQIRILMDKGSGIITVDGRKYVAAEVRDLIEEKEQFKERIRLLERELKATRIVSDQHFDTILELRADIDAGVQQPAQSIDTPEFTRLLAAYAEQAEAEIFVEKEWQAAHDALIAYIDGRTAGTAPQPEAVAWAVTAARGGIHKLSITRESAERKAAAWREEWPDNGCRVRPLVFGDNAAAPSLSGTEEAQ